MTQIVQRPGHVQMKCGTYVGDGGVARTVEVGFQPNFVMVWKQEGSDTADSPMFIWSSDFTSNFCWLRMSGTFGYYDDYITGATATGFIVDDGGTDRDPNTNTATYIYVAFKYDET